VLKRLNLLILIYVTSNWCSGQIVFEQGIVQGGVTGAGFSTGEGFGSGSFDIFIESGSTINKAYLFFYSQRNPPPVNYLVNGYIINTNDCILVNEHNYNVPPWPFADPIRLYVKEISNIIDSEESSINVTIPSQPDLNINEGFWAVYLVVIYENPSLANTNYSIILNNQSLTGFELYNVDQLNPITTGSPVGFSIFTDRHTFSPLDRSLVAFNAEQIGEIYTTDAVNDNFVSSGVKGHFYYQNNTFYGLDDDLPNNTMIESDGIADVSEYITNNVMNVSFTMQHVGYPSQPLGATNINLAYFLTYTSSCLPFFHSLLTSDTTACANSPVQLGASGGIAYEWLPQTNLSCYNCPNPIFTGDSTINYTVRIWSTDSCSVVKPVRVRVVPQPTFESIDITENICGFESGSILGTSMGSALPHTYQLNDGAPQNNFSFSNLPTGSYTITVTDANGCSRDSTVQILEINNIQAAFSVNPSTGAAPLQVQTQNNSQNATQYEWFWEDQSSTLTNPSITLDTAGVYTLTLVAGNGAEHCNDTTTLQIVVYDSLQIVIPNVFTPNNDNANDWFGITSNRDISGTVIILNRWGNLMLESTFSAQTGVFENLWDGTSTSSAPASTGLAIAPEGVYFYRIIVNEEDVEFSGFVHLVR
jgi:gliding motility-associated-like protein